MREPLVIANWKMHGDTAANNALVLDFQALTDGCTVQCVLCPPYPYLGQVGALLSRSAKSAKSTLMLGAQDCSHSDLGAYTGEVSPRMLADVGCQWVILGHSERRQYHQESDALIAAKLAAALRSGLGPVLCVGETLEQRESSEAKAVVTAQLRGALEDLPDLAAITIAYEPVWAIGTGLTASPDEAQEMHEHVRAVLHSMDARNASTTRILYGGSVKADNAAALFEQTDIDGALVGGASLDAEAFAAIVAAA